MGSTEHLLVGTQGKFKLTSRDIPSPDPSSPQCPWHTFTAFGLYLIIYWHNPNSVPLIQAGNAELDTLGWDTNNKAPHGDPWVKRTSQTDGLQHSEM